MHTAHIRGHAQEGRPPSTLLIGLVVGTQHP